MAASAQDLQLVSEPKQVEQREGAFRVGSGTRIVLGAVHAREDRTAAEMLAEEIRVATGRKVAIITSRALPESFGVIYLARVGDDPRLRAALGKRGLGIDDDFDSEGYVLEVDPNRVWVSAGTGQGLFTAHKRCGSCFDRARPSLGESARSSR